MTNLAKRFDFGLAIVAMKQGKRVAREGWFEGVFLVLVPGSKGLTVDEGRPLAKAGVPVGTKFDYRLHIDVFSLENSFCPWNPTQADMLADDWMLVE